MDKSDRLLEVSCVADRLGCSVATVYRHRGNNGAILKFVNVGPRKGIRVLESSVNELLKKTDKEDSSY